MTREQLIEAVARKMALDEMHDPDARVFMARSAPATIGDCQVYFLHPHGGGGREVAIWECYRKAAEWAVDTVASITS